MTTAVSTSETGNARVLTKDEVDALGLWHSTGSKVDRLCASIVARSEIGDALFEVECLRRGHSRISVHGRTSRALANLATAARALGCEEEPACTCSLGESDEMTRHAPLCAVTKAGKNW